MPPPRRFDLVAGADDLHSQVRRLVFGDPEPFERFLGIKVAVLEVDGYRPRDELAYVVHRALGQQVGRFAMRGDRTMFIFVFADRAPEVPAHIDGQKELLRERFSTSGWESAEILAALAQAKQLYMDRVSQIRMESWARGRVALLGDAASCASLLAGQGSALAMVAAYVLAGELKRAGGDYAKAFAAYRDRLGAFIAAKQKAALKLAAFFVPRSRFGIVVGNQVMKLMSIPFVTELAVGRSMQDKIKLPEY